MVGYVQSLERLGFPLSEEFATDVILNSLPSVYGAFISNYHIHGMDKKVTELHGMLKTAEADIKRGTNQVLMVQSSKIKKKSWSTKKAKSKGAGQLGSAANASSVTKSTLSSPTVCFYCKEEGHWKRNCDKYQAEKGKMSGSKTSDSGTVVVNVIDLYLADAPNGTCVYDTGSVVHI